MKLKSKKGEIVQYLREIFLVMRITLFIILLSTTFTFSSNSYAQDTKLSLQMNNVMVKDVLKAIEDQSEFIFFYQDQQIDLNRKVNIVVEEKNVSEILDQLFSGTENVYIIRDRQITVGKSQKLLESKSLSREIVFKEALQPQKKELSGTVKDSNGLSLPGVSVVVKGTTIGTITDADGRFKITAPSDSKTLVFSFIGMKAVELPANDQAVLNVKMSPDNIGLDEVVVTGMGITRDKKSLGYAISKVTGAELIEAGTTTNPILSLYGKAAGVTIRQTASGPTGGINVNIRGAAGLQADAKTRPLFVVDGVPIFDENTGINSTTYDYGTGINDINADDIESMEILKGAKASVLYGGQGANGVVLITTKSGKGAGGKVDANVSYQSTIEQPLTYIDFQNQYGSGANIYDVKSINPGDKYPVANYSSINYGPAFDASQQRIWWDGVARPYVARPNNYDFLFKNGSSNEVNASISKSGTFGNLRFSFTNYDYTGYVENYDQNKNTFSFAGTFKFTNKLTIETSTNLYKIKTHNRPTTTNFARATSRDAPFQEFVENKDYLYTDSGNKNYGYKKDFDNANYPTTNYALQDYANYAWNNHNNIATDDKMHLITTVKPTYHITDWLTVSGQASLDYTNTDFTAQNRETAIYPNLVGGYYGFSRRNTQIEDYKGMVSFLKSYIDNKLDVSAFIGTEYNKVSENTIGVSTSSQGTGSGFIYPGWYNLNNQNPAGWATSTNMGAVRSNSFGSDSQYGVFGTATLTWDQKYTLELSARNDWSSSLPPNRNSYFYPGVAFTWNATDILQNILPSLQFGKFRASWADVGRAAPSRYYAYQSYSAGLISGTNAQSVSSQSSLFAGDLKPERKREAEFGTEMSFFKGNRLGIDLSVYTNSVYDQIMSVPLSQSTGATEIRINAGKVNNWGYELQLKGAPIVTQDFRWDLTFNTANQFSKVIKLYPGITEKNVTGMRGQVYVKAIEGERIGNIYGTALRKDPNGNRIVSTSGASYSLDLGSSTKIGNVFPNFVGGFNSSFQYKGFRLYAHMDYSFGASMYSESNQWLYYNGTSKLSLNHRDEAHGGIAYYINSNGAYVRADHNSQTPNGEKLYHDGIILPGVQEVKDASGAVTGYRPNDAIAAVSSYYAGFVSWSGEAINAIDLKYKNDYVKLREIALSYTIPTKIIKRLKMTNATVSVFGRNLGYLYKTVPNLDSEAYMGTDSYFEASIIPSTRTLGMKLSLGF